MSKPERYAVRNRDYPILQNDNGEKLCRWCQCVLTGRRRAYCSDKCRDEVNIRCGDGLLYYVYARDKGICTHCGMDVGSEESRLKSQTRSIWRNIHGVEFHEPSASRMLALSSFSGGRKTMLDNAMKSIAHKIRNEYLITNTYMSWWSAHHVIAVKDGGGCCGIENIITLCVKCHKDVHAGRIQLRSNNA